ncbi:MAG TPA: glycosyl hydrolase family 28 protein [Verrucomicrobiae bacterium]|nr:glycosyl hydrolase family 28 protein [Verrucomicrobiae bacterium]
MKLVGIAIILASWTALAAELPRSVFDPKSYGARGDGVTNDGGAIQKAIDVCAQAGGGMVYLPPGNFLTGTIVLKSNVTLHLSPGATLWGSRRIEDYKPFHLIYAQDAENIAIEGDGTINGNGDAFWGREFRPIEKRPSPLIELVGCRNVHIRDVRIRNTPGWGIRPWNCDGVYIHGISMISDMDSPNTDGIDPDASRNVFISDSYIETGDDAICLKTDKRPEATTAQACENVTVANCVLISDDSAIKLGTASWGDFRDCTFANCVITGTRYGIAMYIKDGGLVEGIRFANITIDTSVAFENARTGRTRSRSEYPIFLDLERRGEGSALGRIRDVSFSDISIRGKGRVLVAGGPERPLENLSFHNILMRVTGFETVAKEHKPRGVGKIRAATPEADYGPVPAAFIFANIRGLDLRDMRVIWDTEAAPQDRHAIYAGRVEDLSISGFSGGPAGTKLAAIGLEKTKHVFITAAGPNPGTAVFVGVSGVPGEEIALTGNNLPTGVKPVQAGASYVHLP